MTLKCMLPFLTKNEKNLESKIAVFRYNIISGLKEGLVLKQCKTRYDIHGDKIRLENCYRFGKSGSFTLLDTASFIEQLKASSDVEELAVCSSDLFHYFEVSPRAVPHHDDSKIFTITIVYG